MSTILMCTATNADRTVRWRRIHIGCPGCGDAHSVNVPGENGETSPDDIFWDWNGDLENLSISPSILVRYNYGDQSEQRVCHSFFRSGKWEFLADCTHEFAGQTVEPSELPDWMESR